MSFYSCLHSDMKNIRGTWVAQSLEHLTVDISSGLDLSGREFKSCIGLRGAHLKTIRGTWVAQLVKHLPSAQFMVLES